MSHTPPGWYPEDDGRQRYWDAAQWNEQLDPSLALAVDGAQPELVTFPAAATATDPLVDRTRLHRSADVALTQNLMTGEHVAVIITGNSDQALIGTDRRAFIFKKGFMAGATFGSAFTSWDYLNLVGVQIHTGMVNGAVVLQVPGKPGIGTSKSRTDDDPYQATNAIPLARPFNLAELGVVRLRQLITAAHNAATVARSTNSLGSLADELRKFVDLRDAGALTDSEFQQVKARLLADGVVR